MGQSSARPQTAGSSSGASVSAPRTGLRTLERHAVAPARKNRATRAPVGAVTYKEQNSVSRRRSSATRLPCRGRHGSENLGSEASAEVVSRPWTPCIAASRSVRSSSHPQLHTCLEKHTRVKVVEKQALRAGKARRSCLRVTRCWSAVARRALPEDEQTARKRGPPVT
ncbi:hypothetical protein GN956_G19268 [Arapaima gigas]